jgi:virginiamycin A acetyltransferase
MREALKAVAYALATVVIAPALLSFYVRRAIIGGDRALEGSTQALAIVPGLVGVYLRGAFLAIVLEHFERSASVHFGTIFSQTRARIDANVYVGPRCHLGLVHLERDVLLAAGVHVPSGANTHGTDDIDTPIRDQGGSRTLVRIGSGSWVGSAAVVLADVGRHSVIAAGAVVTKPVGDFVVAGGVPAKVLKTRTGAHGG